MSGTLFVVATPIGNLEDLTFRALRTLKEVDLIAAEDTRRTAKLLAHYEIRKSMVSLREHNEVRETPRLIARLQGGENIALVSDAGTPGISDPGAHLVRAAHEHGIRVVPIPGPSAVSAALSASGFGGGEFVFLGFPPSSGEARDDWFHRLATETRVAVFFESPHRIGRTIGELDELVKRPITIGRELTKANESLAVRQNNGHNYKLQEIGEFVIIVEKASEEANQAIDPYSVADLFYRLTNLAAIDETEALDIVSQRFNLPKPRVKNIVKKARIEAKRQQNRLP
jgi:16S rRNA (cytidine1402-2'-O)-methyltransferase